MGLNATRQSCPQAGPNSYPIRKRAGNIEYIETFITQLNQP